MFLNILVLSTVCLQATFENMNFTKNWAVWAVMSNNNTGNISGFFHIFRSLLNNTIQQNQYCKEIVAL